MVQDTVQRKRFLTIVISMSLTRKALKTEGRCGSRYKLLQFYIYADADKRAARFVARGETKAKFEAREQSEDEQFCDYENNHGWDITTFTTTGILTLQ